MQGIPVWEEARGVEVRGHICLAVTEVHGSKLVQWQDSTSKPPDAVILLRLWRAACHLHEYQSPLIVQQNLGSLCFCCSHVMVPVAA